MFNGLISTHHALMTTVSLIDCL